MKDINPIPLTFDRLVEVAQTLKTKFSHAAIVCSLADYEALIRHANEQGLFVSHGGTFFGVHLFRHIYLPRGEMMALDTVARAEAFCRALTEAQAAGRPWQSAMAAVMKP